MTFLQAIVSIVVALIAGTTGGGLVFTKFMIERRDKLEADSIQKRIDEAVKKAEERMQEKLDAVSTARSLEGKTRFETHAAAIQEINEQIKANSQQIGELTALSKAQINKMDVFTESMASLTKMARMSAESQRSNTYDRILMVANKVLKNQKITITEKTNLKQLYSSWEDFHAEGEKKDPKIVTIYEECMKLTLVPDEN